MVNRNKKSRKSGPERRNAAGTTNIEAWRGKAALKHGIRSLIASRGDVMPSVPHADEIRADVDALMDEMVSDLGGESQVTAGQRTILRSQRLCLLVLGLASSYLSREGIVNPKSGKPHALLSVCATYANAARLNALALGLERRARKVGPTSLDEYLEQRENAKPEMPAESEAVEVPEPEQ